MATRSKLAVILHADVVGSTTLVQMDERIAHERMQNAFRRLSDTISGYGGTTHELRGDALVAEFERASDAVSAALAFQAANSRHNQAITGDIRPEIRIGVSLGEVVIADQTVTGTGVVLAQRIEQLAPPGGVSISAAIREAVPGRLPLEFEDLGPQELKGFDRPQPCHHVTLSQGATLPSPESREAEVGAREAPTSGARTSLAALPFQNLSNDPEQEYLADGITEELLTALSRYRWFTVVARSSIFSFKGTSVGAVELGERLGVAYIAEGSVRRAGKRIRVSAQLVETATGNRIWSERYNRELDDVFDLQDEIAETIAAAIEPELSTAEVVRIRRRPPKTPAAWDWYLQGLSNMWTPEITLEQNREARRCFAEALALDDRLAPALAADAFTLMQGLMGGFDLDMDDPVALAISEAQTAIQLDDRDAFSHMALGRAFMHAGRNDAAIREQRRAIDLNPSLAWAHFSLGIALHWSGDPEASISAVKRTIELSPHDQRMWTFLMLIGVSYVLLRQYDTAIEWFEQSIARGGDYLWLHTGLAVAHARLGNTAGASASLDRARQHKPDLSVTSLAKLLEPLNPEYREGYLAGLREAGLEE